MFSIYSMYDSRFDLDLTNNKNFKILLTKSHKII